MLVFALITIGTSVVSAGGRPKNNISQFSEASVGSTGIPGDLDGDGDVDLADFSIFCWAFGSKKGDPNYIPGADLDHDGDVDMDDFELFMKYYEIF